MIKKLTLLNKLGSLRQVIAVGALLTPIIGKRFIPYPYMMTLVVTHRCDSRCQMCSIWKEKQSPFLSLEQIERILSRNNFSFIRSVTLSGGEPTLRADLPQLFEIILEHLPNLEHVLLATNGFNTHRIVEQVNCMLETLDTRDNRVRGFGVQISLDGIDQVHDTVRGIHDSFQKVKATLAQLRALQTRFSRLNLRLHCTLMSSNLPYIDSLGEFAKQQNLEISYSPVIFSHEYHNNLHKMEDLSLSDDDRVVAQRFFEQLGQEDKTIFRFHYRDVAQMLQDNPRRQRCMMGFYGFVLEHDGNVYPCVNYEKTGFGNLLTDSFKDVWFGALANDARRQIRSESCSTCPAPCYPNPVNFFQVAQVAWQQLIELRSGTKFMLW